MALLNLLDKEYKDFYTKLVNEGQIKSCIGFGKDEENFVLIEEGGRFYKAQLRAKEFDGKIGYTIYPLEKDYVCDEAPFSCAGTYDIKDDKINLTNISLAVSNKSKAGIKFDDLTGKPCVYATIATRPYISIDKQYELMNEYEQIKTEEQFNAFTQKYADFVQSNPIEIEMKFNFKNDVFDDVRNISDAYDFLENLLTLDNRFREKYVDDDCYWPLYHSMIMGDLLKDELAYNNVDVHVSVSRQDPIYDEPLQTLFSASGFVKQDNNNIVSAITSIDVLDIQDGYKLHYNVGVLPEYYQIDKFGNIMVNEKNGNPIKANIDTKSMLEDLSDFLEINKDIQRELLLGKGFEEQEDKASNEDDFEDEDPSADGL